MTYFYKPADEAELLYRRALSITEAVHEPGHSKVAMILRSLAVTPGPGQGRIRAIASPRPHD